MKLKISILIKDNTIDYDEEYRSPGWSRFKRNKMLKWKK